ncbi:Hypothetical predicted protein [Scomber scombrus]|uniref:Uncharacterized protein n=1 Tax=Scomber scombrus TaxID=13677 RepID=A0AAV1PI88_SCOSC
MQPHTFLVNQPAEMSNRSCIAHILKCQMILLTSGHELRPQAGTVSERLSADQSQLNMAATS